MFPGSCDAVLKNCKNQTLEVGTAAVSIKERSADFVSSFVPLIKLGDEAKIICTHNNIATHVVTGKVYLSSSQLLRLIEIQCTILPNAENSLATNEELPAEIYLPIFKTDLLGKRVLHIWQHCTVLSVAMDKITIRCKRLPEEYAGELRIRMHAPLFQEPTELKLKLSGQGVFFGRHAKYECSYSELSSRLSAQIGSYIRDFAIRQLEDTV